MTLSSKDLNDLCQIAINASGKAGRLIRENAEQDFTVKNKEGADSLASQVVTEVDIKAQNVILEYLMPTLERFDLALLTEESTDDNSRFKKEYFWCIDPMDGTLPFTEKTPGYAVSIGLVSRSGKPMLGVVYDPCTEELYHAITGQGAFKNEKTWKPDLKIGNKSTFYLNIDRNFVNHPKYNNVLNDLNALITDLALEKIEIQKTAGAVLSAIKVMEKAPGCYFKLPKPTPGGGSLWDFAATSCIIKEAGAYGSDIFGDPLDLNRKDSSFMNHKGVFFASNKELAEKIMNLPFMK